MPKESKSLEQFVEDWQDERIRELQKMVDNMSLRYQPKPGDPDYLTPEQVNKIQKALEEVD
ncbi:hypothetical protein HYZ97_03650 [Candidatus Pacearchaeota archaeon]|nr:hypothetical protein [Candidatus Pacearchaeota archaeon]